VNIVAVSDTHGRHRDLEIPEGDVFVHAGDLTKTGTIDELRDVAEWIEGLSFSHKVIVAGNHDFCLEHPAKRDEAEHLLADFTYLRDESAGIDGLNFWGSPWTPVYGQWAFQKQRGDEIAGVWESVSDGVDVLVTHGPPRGIGDRTRGGKQVGCQQLRECIRGCRPRLHLFGHIHEARGDWTVEGIQCVNASVTTVGYGAVQPPGVMRIEEEEVKLVST
jgi:Icc-related predicted phosphoesterase